METWTSIVLATGVLVFAVTILATVLCIIAVSLSGLVGAVQSLLDAIAERARHAALPHRRVALAACAEAIERVKKQVPIWKKEHFEGGAVWVEGDPSAAGGPVRVEGSPHKKPDS